MTNRFIFSLFVFLSFSGKAQSDTNYLCMDYLKLDFSDSTEKLTSLVLNNDSNTLVFTDTSKFKMIGINRYNVCNLMIRTNKSDILFENINEYISYSDTKYRLTIFFPANHSTCVYGSYYLPDGSVAFHSQTLKSIDIVQDFDFCADAYADPTNYSKFIKFVFNYVLE